MSDYLSFEGSPSATKKLRFPEYILFTKHWMQPSMHARSKQTRMPISPKSTNIAYSQEVLTEYLVAGGMYRGSVAGVRRLKVVRRDGKW